MTPPEPRPSDHACDWPGCEGQCHTGETCPCHPVTPPEPRPPCKAWTRAWTGRLLISGGHRCRYPARFRVTATEPHKVAPEDVVCGVHVRPYLMDNGDSVRKPWIVTKLEGSEVTPPEPRPTSESAFLLGQVPPEDPVTPPEPRPLETALERVNGIHEWGGMAALRKAHKVLTTKGGYGWTDALNLIEEALATPAAEPRS